MSTLMACENHSIPYGVIRGEARPLKGSEVIRSPHVSDVTGVIQQIKTREHKSEWSRTTRLWYVGNNLQGNLSACNVGFVALPLNTCLPHSTSHLELINLFLTYRIIVQPTAQ